MLQWQISWKDCRSQGPSRFACRKEGTLADCLNLVSNCEVGDRKIVSETITRIGVSEEIIPEFYIDAMSNTSRIEKNITKIKETFESFDIKGPKSQILESLRHFELNAAGYKDTGPLSAVIKWYKSQFLQKTSYFPRAEQLLDEALELFQNSTEPIFQHWILKIYISLGYVHLAQLNYLDSDSYLKDALNMALSESTQSVFLGEIYPLLSTVNLRLGRHSQSKKYITLERERCHKNYHENKSDESLARTYAYALVNFSRINHLMGLVDHRIQDDLIEAIDIFSRLADEKGLLLARLGEAEFLYLDNRVNSALEAVLDLEPVFTEMEMYRELMDTILLAAKIYQKVFDFEQAEKKLNQLFTLAEEQSLTTDLVMADAYYEMGSLYYAVNEESKAFDYFRESAKIGMVLGVKNVIVRSFNATRSIDKYKARELLVSDLVYEDAAFMRNRLERKINPFKETRAKVKLFASTLFVDIVGFSSMMKGSDEDVIIRMIDELIDRMYLVIYQHNGYIDKFLGDGFMAIFEHGYSTNPDVSFNAIKSGIDIHRALQHKNRRLKKIYGVDKNINVRIGVSTGEIYAIVVGNYIKTEFTYLGNSVNLASKLESQATKELILIDDETYAQVKDWVLSEPERIFIPGLGETIAHKVFRPARMSERPKAGKLPSY